MCWIERLMTLFRHLRAIPPTVRDFWQRDYRDARIIVEQAGNLHYLSVSGRLQRLMVRGGIVVGGGVLTSLTALMVAALVLHQIRLQEERQHQAIYSALVESFKDAGYTDGEKFSAADMVELARNIRQRDVEIRGLVASATTQLASENSSFKSLLGSSGLTEKAIKIIQGGGEVGGFGPKEGDTQVASSAVSLLGTPFMEEAADNRALNDIMQALPAHMPVADHRKTSLFGIRKHPLLGSPRLHAGIDLVPHTDDRVFPTKEGRVVLARDYSNYGKTVIVRHDRGIESLYAHLDQINVVEGQEVGLDTLLGMVGNTGTSTGKHLHFEISVGGYPVDPMKVIRTAQYVQ